MVESSYPSARFQDQVAVITGAATGLGEGIARRLATEGASVALFDRDAPRLQATLESFQSGGLKAQGYEIDVSNENSVRDGMEKVARELGPLHIMVNCAGIVAPLIPRSSIIRLKTLIDSTPSICEGHF